MKRLWIDHLISMLAMHGIVATKDGELIGLADFIQLVSDPETGKETITISDLKADDKDKVIVINGLSALEDRMMGMTYDQLIMDELPWPLYQAKKRRENEWYHQHAVRFDPRKELVKATLRSQQLRKQQRNHRKVRGK